MHVCTANAKNLVKGAGCLGSTATPGVNYRWPDPCVVIIHASTLPTLGFWVWAIRVKGHALFEVSGELWHYAMCVQFSRFSAGCPV